MASTTSIAFPRMFDVVSNSVRVLEGNASIQSRSRLLLLSDEFSLYNSPNFGASLKQYLFQYRSDNHKSILYDKMRGQLRLYEPYVDPDKTTFTDISDTYDSSNIQLITDSGKLQIAVGLTTVFGDTIEILLSEGDNTHG